MAHGDENNLPLSSATSFGSRATSVVVDANVGFPALKGFEPFRSLRPHSQRRETRLHGRMHCQLLKHPHYAQNPSMSEIAL